MNDRSDVLKWLKSRRIAVLKGGWSSERAISLKTGLAVQKSLERWGLNVQAIDVNRDIAEDLKRKKIGFCFIALHGPFGEDGRIQSLLEILNIPYTGSGVLASGMAMDKDLSKKLFLAAGVPTASWITLSLNQSPEDRKFKFDCIRKILAKGPVFVKPADQGSAIGVSRVDKWSGLNKALSACFKYSDRALVEKFVDGRELTVGILGDVPLPVIEIIPQHRFYDFHSKYAPGGSRHVVPADLPAAVSRRVQQLSWAAFRAVGCSVVGRVDLILQANGDIMVLEINTIPGMTNTSLLPEAAKADGIGFDELVMQIMERSLDARATKI